jgi:hypothetical protein
MKILLLIGIFVTAAFAHAEVSELESARREYLAELEKIATERSDRFQVLQAGYLKNLQDFRKAATAQGNLDNVMAVRAEIDRVTNWVEPPESEKKKLPSDLQPVRRQYDAGLARIVADGLAKSTALRQAYARDLEAMQRRLTQLDQIDAALVVKQERNRLLEAMKDTPPAPPTTPVTPEVPAVTPANPVSQKKISIRALIDGSDELLIAGLRVWYVHRNGANPGRSNNQTEPTVVNGQKWQPVWRDGRCIPYDRLMTALPSMELPSLAVKKVAGRGEVRILAQPSRENHYTLSIQINDSGSGSDWYELEISW